MLNYCRTLVNAGGQIYNITYKDSDGVEVLVTDSKDHNLYSISPDVYQITIGNYIFEYKFYLGGVYALLLVPNSTTTYVCTMEIYCLIYLKFLLLGRIYN